jgi:hypothetical protein
MYKAENGMSQMHSERSDWRIHHIGQTMLECQNELVHFINIKEKNPTRQHEKPIGNTGSVGTSHSNAGPGELSSTIDHLLCLPDTVDPRERKQ